MRAYKVAVTPPMGPVFLSLDAELQENPIHDPEELRIPRLSKAVPPQADSGASGNRRGSIYRDRRTAIPRTAKKGKTNEKGQKGKKGEE